MCNGIDRDILGTLLFKVKLLRLFAFITEKTKVERELYFDEFTEKQLGDSSTQNHPTRLSKKRPKRSESSQKEQPIVEIIGLFVGGPKAEMK